MAACASVGSDFAAPARPGSAPPSAMPPAAPPSAPAADWWSVFGDATLDRLEQSALRDNPSVKAAAQRLLQAQAQSWAARANQGLNVN